MNDTIIKTIVALASLEAERNGDLELTEDERIGARALVSSCATGAHGMMAAYGKAIAKRVIAATPANPEAKPS